MGRVLIYLAAQPDDRVWVVYPNCDNVGRVVCPRYRALWAPRKNLAGTGEPPSATYWLGTDAYGHDIFSRILYGARIDLVIAISAIAVSMAIGSIIGASAGFRGGPTDEVTMRAMDVLQAFPRFIFAMGVAYALGPVLTVIIATATLNVPGYARLMRGMILSLKSANLPWLPRQLVVPRAGYYFVIYYLTAWLQFLLCPRCIVGGQFWKRLA